MFGRAEEMKSLEFEGWLDQQSFHALEVPGDISGRSVVV